MTHRRDTFNQSLGSAAVAVGKPSGWALWLLAARPRTLPLSAAPVLAVLALAWRETGALRPLPALATLAAALLIQIATNLYNDAADGARGGDGPDRLGPRRVVAAGWATAGQVKGAAAGCAALAALLGVYLSWVGGWPILALGVLSLLAGWGYSGGPRPIAYTRWGEVFVFAFFGLGAVGGVYWLQTGGLSPACLVLGAMMGGPAAAVLLVNNHRDRVGDHRAGRRTLAIVLGPHRSLAVYAALLGGSLLLTPLLAGVSGAMGVLAGLAATPFAMALIQRFRSEPPGRGLNGLLAQTAQFQALLALLIGAGLAFDI